MTFRPPQPGRNLMIGTALNVATGLFAQVVPLILPQTPQKHCDLWKGTVRRRAVDAWEPALPLILAAWHDTPAMLKMVRLAEHIQWAEKHIRVAIGHARHLR